MNNIVVAEDGISYEENNILNHFTTSNLSPVTLKEIG